MARYDKYDGMVGGFRARLGTTIAGNDVGVPLGVGLDENGRVVKGSGVTGVVGLLVVNHAKDAGDAVDVMTSGEVGDCADLSAATVYFANTAGALGATATGTRVGHTIEASRLVVRM